MSDSNDVETRLPNLSEHVQKNRALWEASSNEYEQRHDAALSGGNAMAWGLWRTVPEAARLLRPGGLFVFSTASPISVMCLNVQADQIERILVNDYFGVNHLRL